jgi:hypothetical protein
MGRTCGTYGENKFKRGVVVVDLKERGQLECLGVGGGIILIRTDRK